MIRISNFWKICLSDSIKNFESFLNIYFVIKHNIAVIDVVDVVDVVVDVVDVVDVVGVVNTVDLYNTVGVEYCW